MNPNLKKYQVAIRRSSRGKVLGVFRGIAENQGWSIGLTRGVGIFALLLIAGAFGVDGFRASILAVGFFYLLIAILMRPPLEASEYSGDAEMDLRTPYNGRREVHPRSAAVPHYRVPAARANLANLDRQLDSLNRRIQRMETIVTNRSYDWNRRLNS